MLFHDNSPSQELPSAWNWEWWTFPRTHLIEITIRNFENLSIYPDICIRQHEEWNFDRSKSSRDDNLAWCTIFENRTGRRPWLKDKQETKKFATHNIRKWKNDIRDRNGKQIVPIRKKYQFHRWYHRWPSRTSPTCALRKLEARDSEATTKTENWFWQIFSVSAIPSPTTHDCANSTSSTLPTDCNYPCPNREFKFLLGAASGTTESVFSAKRRWLKNAEKTNNLYENNNQKIETLSLEHSFQLRNFMFFKKSITECGLIRQQ